MNWDDWCKEYPAREIDSFPIHSDGPFVDQIEAENVKDNLELTHEMGGFEVVRYQKEFYVIHEDS